MKQKIILKILFLIFIISILSSCPDYYKEKTVTLSGFSSYCGGQYPYMCGFYAAHTWLKWINRDKNESTDKLENWMSVPHNYMGQKVDFSSRIKDQGMNEETLYNLLTICKYDLVDKDKQWYTNFYYAYTYNIFYDTFYGYVLDSIKYKNQPITAGFQKYNNDSSVHHFALVNGYNIKGEASWEITGVWINQGNSSFASREFLSKSEVQKWKLQGYVYIF